MKKIVFSFLLVIAGIVATGCSSCQSENKKQEGVAELIVENTISADKQYMYLNYGKNYVWYETVIKMKGWLDGETTDAVDSLYNVFQAIIDDGQPRVIFISHKLDTSSVDVKNGFWVEDYDMSKDNVKLTYKQAFDRVMQSNYSKPHTKNCILRKPIGPKDCNPQWCFGNIDSQLWVDAVTGEVTDSDPAF
jgi:hypothetical protein